MKKAEGRIRIEAFRSFIAGSGIELHDFARNSRDSCSLSPVFCRSCRSFAGSPLSFAATDIGDADAYAREFAALAPEFEGDWNDGNAVHDSKMVLGRIAGRADEARRLLFAAGATPGSPQLNSFGPDMSLANDLLDRVEDDAVPAYFSRYRRFWEHGRDDLDRWSADVRAGRSPRFGANLDS